MFFRLLIGALMIGSVYGLIGLGYSTIYKASGLMNFSQGDLFMLGAFVGLMFYKSLKLPFAVAFVLTIIVMFCLGMLIERTIIRQILKRSEGYFIVLATIALSIFFKNFAMLSWGSQRKDFPAIFHIGNLKVGGLSVQPESIFVIVVAFICMLLLHLFTTKTEFGTAMRAAAQDPLAARAVGIDVNLTTGVTWGIAGAVASVGGMLYGPVYGVSMAIGGTIGQRAFSSAVVGGYGNMYGAIVGGLLIGFIETFAAGYISSDFKDFIAFLVLIVFLFVRPTGIFNEKALQD